MPKETLSFLEIWLAMSDTKKHFIQYVLADIQHGCRSLSKELQETYIQLKDTFSDDEWELFAFALSSRQLPLTVRWFEKYICKEEYILKWAEAIKRKENAI